MELGPKIRLRGRKVKSIRFATAELEAFREEMKRNPRWAEYASATDSEMIRIALIFGHLHVKHHEETYLLTLEEINQVVDAAVRLNIGEVARALGRRGANERGQDNHSGAARGRLHRNIQSEVGAGPASDVYSLEMADKSWKKFERRIAQRVGGKRRRHWQKLHGPEVAASQNETPDISAERL